MRPRVLVIDDDPEVLTLLSQLLESGGASVVVERDLHRGMELLKLSPIDALFTECRTLHHNGTDGLRDIRSIQPGLPVVLLGVHDAGESADPPSDSGTIDYLTSPLQADQVTAALTRALAKSNRQSLQIARIGTLGDGVAGSGPPTVVANSPAMKQALTMARQVAASKMPVLLVGELGVGKERVARLIHALSPWSHEPFARFNCEAMQEDQLRETFFGIERAANQGANGGAGGSPYPGVIERAAGGTLFLHNVTGIPRWMQEELLQAIQAGQFLRVGGSEPVPIRARIAASTTCNPVDSVKKGRLLDELHFFFGGNSIVLPPLRDRREDIRPLVDELVHEASRDPSLAARRPAPVFSEGALQLLEAHNWPGNICELSNLVRRVFVFVSEPEVIAAHLAEMLPSLPPFRGAETITVPFVGDLKAIERAIVTEVINRTRGNKSAAARYLGLHRKTLYRIIEHDTGSRSRRASG